MEMAMENITRAQQEVEMSSQFNIRFTVMMNVAQPVGDTSYNYNDIVTTICCREPPTTSRTWRCRCLGQTPARPACSGEWSRKLGKNGKINRFWH